MDYYIFVLGYDLLHNFLTTELDLPVENDVAFRFCKVVYNDFVKSNKSMLYKYDYKCLQDYINNQTHEAFLDILQDCYNYLP
jgi:hypothetical protein